MSIWISIIDLEKEIEQYLTKKYNVDKVKVNINHIIFETNDNTGKLRITKSHKKGVKSK